MTTGDNITPEVINALLQIPLVGALIYLVLKLEDKRQKSAELREQSNQRIVDSLLGVIDELAAKATPDKINSRQLNLIQDYLRDEQHRREESERPR